MKNVEYISASAGSGKTYTLTHKLADAVRGYSVDKEGHKHAVIKIEPEQVILTTYTVKAATEFREKAKAAMHEAGLHEEAERLDQAMIGTVHSVADAFIHKYWHRLGISPELNVMTDDDKDFFINQSLASLPTEAELKRLNNFSYHFSVGYKYGSGKYGINYEHWQEDLKKIVDYTTNYDIQDYTSSEEYSKNIINSFCQEGTHIRFDKGEALRVLNELDALNAQGRQSGASVSRKSTIDEYRRKLKYINYSELAGLHDFILGLPKSVCGDDAAAFVHTLDGLWVSEEVRDMQLEYVNLLFKFAKEWRRKFEEYKRTKHLIDYNDMEKLFYQLLFMPDVAEDIREEYRYLLVDEFQDSSPIQVKIFDKLSEIVDRSVWVGDYKQAIYGFRGADTDLVKAVTEQIGKHENGCTTNTLDTNYRSYPEIVETCNKVLVPAFTVNNTLTEEQVKLKPHKENKEKLQNLRVWPIEGKNKGEKTEETVKRIIEGYGLTENLTTPSQIINAWDRLEKYLTTHYGQSVRRYHELPFKHLVNGQIVTGSMDFVWKTSNGCVLIDYKTFPGSEQLVLTPGNHYAGNYKGQFDCYTNALEAAGEHVIARFVYYPVTGMLIKI